MVKDTNVNEHNGSFIDWRLTLWGECIDPDKQELLPLPTEDDDDDHDRISASPTTVSINPGETATAPLPALPSDHQDRPVNSKPGKPAETTAHPTEVPVAEEGTGIPNATGLPDTPEESDSSDEHFLPHIFPTFGVSKRTQIWIYGALAIIVIFCTGLGAYLLIVRRRRNRNQRDDYEFEMLDEDDHFNSAAGGRRTKRRAGELYDAFAGESDEEQLLSDGDEDEDEEQDEKQAYRDTVPARDKEIRNGDGSGNMSEKH